MSTEKSEFGVLQPQRLDEDDVVDSEDQNSPQVKFSTTDAESEQKEFPVEPDLHTQREMRKHRTEQAGLGDKASRLDSVEATERDTGNQKQTESKTKREANKNNSTLSAFD